MVTVAEPASIGEAVAIMRENDGEAKYLAGGTALVLLVRMKMLDPKVLVSLRGIGDLRGWSDIETDADQLLIGGGVSVATVATHPLVKSHAPSLARAAAVVGNTRIRNAATIGGLMAEADYASDPPATLVSLGAEVVMSNGVVDRSLPVHDFIPDFFTTELEDAEIVTGVRVPLGPEGRRSTYLKFSSRSVEDRPCVGVAVSADFVEQTVSGLRVVIGAVSGQPQWFPQITQDFIGRELTDKDIKAIADAYSDEVDPIEDSRGSQWYRREVVRGQVARALRQIRDGEGA